jgi:4-hydroxy-tetrahydrodipicolinate reductase
MLKIAILGAGGQMGLTIIRVMADMPEAVLTGALEAPQSPLLGKDAGRLAGVADNGVKITDVWEKAIDGADVLIDFSFPSATVISATKAAEKGKPMVIGTTGLNQEESDAVRRAAGKIPIVWAPNMSLGVNVLFALTGKLAGVLADYDIEIVEMHHRRKKDAPSGTALRLAENAAIARKQALGTAMTHGRHGAQSARTPGQIGMHAVRGGDIVGDHTVIFAGDGERVELTHRASRRECFASGALRAAAWVKDRKPGLYNMQDVLGLNAVE